MTKKEKYISLAGLKEYFRSPMPTSVKGIAQFMKQRKDQLKPIEVGEGISVRYYYKASDVMEFVEKFFRGEVK